MAHLTRFFRSLFRSQTLQYTDAEILFLTTFLYPRPLRDNTYAEEADWISLLGTAPTVTAQRFIDDRLIRPALPRETLMARLPAAQLIDAADRLGLNSNKTIYEIAESILRVPGTSALCTALSFYCSTDLGQSVANAFVARAGIENEKIEHCRPPAKFVAHIQAAIKWFALAATAGVVGNRTDALFVDLQQAKLRSDRNTDAHVGPSSEHLESGTHGSHNESEAGSTVHTSSSKATDSKGQPIRHELPYALLEPKGSPHLGAHAQHGHGPHAHHGHGPHAHDGHGDHSEMTPSVDGGHADVFTEIIQNVASSLGH